MPELNTPFDAVAVRVRAGTVVFMMKATLRLEAEMTDTSDFSFTSGDVENLTHALSEIAVNLSKEQWGLLLSIFAAASDGFEISQNRKKGTFSGVKVDDGVIDDPKEKTVPQLCDQLRRAYMPGSLPRRRADNMGIGMITPIKPGGH